MVCNRCKTKVKDELNNLGIPYVSVELGEITTVQDLTPAERGKLKDQLCHSGFELIDEQKNKLIEKLKTVILDLEHHSDEDLKTSFTEYINLTTSSNFISLNTLFAEIKGMTIETYIISHKIERIKELLVYDDLEIDEIALTMHYSSIAQLVKQFKRFTGLTPTHFRQLRLARITIPVQN